MHLEKTLDLYLSFKGTTGGLKAIFHTPQSIVVLLLLGCIYLNSWSILMLHNGF